MGYGGVGAYLNWILCFVTCTPVSVYVCVYVCTCMYICAGEVPFIRSSIDRFDVAARARGVAIVHCCGYDSIPSDLGTLMVVRHLQRSIQPVASASPPPPIKFVHAYMSGKGGMLCAGDCVCHCVVAVK